MSANPSDPWRNFDRLVRRCTAAPPGVAGGGFVSCVLRWILDAYTPPTVVASTRSVRVGGRWLTSEEAWHDGPTG